jgi:hypothetical protein
MATMTRSRAARKFDAVRAVWRELSYARHRTFELKTGIAVLRPDERPRLRGTVEELENLFAWDESRLRNY